MDGKRHWLGWIAIGISCLALLAALFGPGFGRGSASAGFSGLDAPPSSMQRGSGRNNSGPQGNMAGPGANVQPGQGQSGGGPQGNATGPAANAQRGRGQMGRSQGGPTVPGANMQRGPEQRRGNGFGLGGWFRLPFKLIGGAFQTAMLALLILLGLWFFRGRGASGASASGASASGRTEPVQSPSQSPTSPTGESYSDE